MNECACVSCVWVPLTSPVGVRVSVVDMYDTVRNRWSTARLSVPRYDMSAAALGTKALFAGGYSGELASNLVDVSVRFGIALHCMLIPVTDLRPVE